MSSVARHLQEQTCAASQLDIICPGIIDVSMTRQAHVAIQASVFFLLLLGVLILVCKQAIPDQIRPDQTRSMLFICFVRLAFHNSCPNIFVAVPLPFHPCASVFATSRAERRLRGHPEARLDTGLSQRFRSPRVCVLLVCLLLRCQ